MVNLCTQKGSDSMSPWVIPQIRNYPNTPTKPDIDDLIYGEEKVEPRHSEK